MKRTTRTATRATLVLVACAGIAAAQRGGGRRAATPPPPPPRIIAIPCIEACHMMERMRVWMFTPPASATAFGLGALGTGHRLWALLPSCRAANPDDPRDPCPVHHAAVELISGTGEVHSTEPQAIVSGDETSRRVQSFVVPTTAEQVRLKLVRSDNTVRYEAAVDAAQLHQLPEPQGHADGNTFAFELSAYPSR